MERAATALSGTDELRCAQIRLAFIYDMVAAKAASTRTCPGPYWRKRPEIQEAIAALNKQGKTKRARYDLSQTECIKHNQPGGVGGAASFDRCYTGPPRTHAIDKEDTRRILCENCGQLLNRDRKNKVLILEDPEAKEPLAEEEEDVF